MLMFLDLSLSWMHPSAWMTPKSPVVLSRLRSGLSTHLCGLSFEGQGAFAT
jgi:hypothetical protein